ncbi:MAG TPA: TonB-dependent receptor [Terriglobales bacterium]|nr:TonB-dependent receptor [Terriglobales bacterium]
MLLSFGKSPRAAFLATLFLFWTANALSQSGGSSTSVVGTVTDQSGAVVPNATVEIHNPVSQFDRSTTTDSTGKFTIPNVPFNNYHLSASAPGFSPYSEDINVRSVVPVGVPIQLNVQASSTKVTVEASSSDLLENTPTFHTDVDRDLFQKLPLESQSSSVSSLVTLSTPGIAADSNGNFHGMGDHAENSFVVDGQPITDQQSKVFSNQIPADSIESLEVIPGAPPAEYGDKTSVVINVTTRSGQGLTTPTGSISASYGSFGTSTADVNLGYGGKNWGNFISASGLNSGRFLDPPEFTIMHAKGNEENLFDRVDFQASQADSIHFNLGFTRSWFQTPNSFDMQNATAWNGLVVNNGGLGPDGLPVGPTDQRSKITTFNIAPSWTRLINNSTVFTLGAWGRRDQFNYYPSHNPFSDFVPDLQSTSVSQDRNLTNAGLRSNVSYVKGIHNIKVGADYAQTFLNENDGFGIVDPTFIGSLSDVNGNPCVDVNGNAIASPCTDLAPYDLTVGGTKYHFSGHTDVKELSMYVQDAITKGSWSFNVGIRGDLYNGLSVARMAEPRLGGSYNIKRTSTILRLSYARIMETPFNENLVLSSVGCANPVLNPLLVCTSNGLTPISPGRRNEFHAGAQQAFGRHIVVSAEYVWKYTHNAYDFSIFANSPITFPIEWQKSKITGPVGRVNLTNFHGLSAFTVFGSVAARFFLPQLGGAGATPSAPGGVFRIDHDQKFNQTTHLQYQPRPNLPWFGFNWRYDSGLVAGPVPCAGGNCNNGPNGTSTIVDVSNLTPDQQFQAGLFCGTVRATPSNPISATGLCPASIYGSSLISIPAPGTANADHNPPRIAARNLFDLSLGDDNLFHGDKRKWSAQFTVVNLTNQYALYNFLSTFSGTHYVSPRAYTATLGFHF